MDLSALDTTAADVKFAEVEGSDRLMRVGVSMIVLVAFTVAWFIALVLCSDKLADKKNPLWIL